MSQTSSKITIDEFSLSAVPIEMFFDSKHLSIGTAFIWEHDGQFFLITNWHNLSGRNPFTGKHLSNTATEPNRLKIWFNAKTIGDRFKILYDLYDPSGQPLWWVHPKMGSAVDVVALPVAIAPEIEMRPINQMPSKPLLVQVGMDVFVLGYPYGINSSALPIWKRASIASEPALVGVNEHYFLLDTATRPGMSGSPIIRRSWGMHTLEGNNMEGGTGAATRFVGIYSGRLKPDDPLDAQLGLAWPANVLMEIVAGRTRDSKA